ncbi:MAG: protein kinase [Acidobacteria bacterium]|nr:protein kinase [Acidobacteriota bacterium]
MKQCGKCRRLLSSRADHCIYCGALEVSEVVLEKEGAISSNYRVNTHEIMVDGIGYEILQPLGKGGFGTVLQVRSIQDNRDYALKVPLMFDMACTNSNAHDDETVGRSARYIENEIETISGFDNDTFLYVFGKGTATAFYRGEEVSFPVFRMELAIATLDDLLRLSSSGRLQLPEEEKKKMVREITNAMTNLHDLNIVHRDLSPDNIFLVDRAGKISYVLGDFGASKRLFDAVNTAKSTRIVGHTAYLDPQRFADKDYRYDYRIDLYGMGIILTEVLIGRYWRNLFDDEDISLNSIDFEKDVLAKLVRPMLEQTPVIEVLQKAVRVNPDERYKSMHEFQEALFSAMGISSEDSSIPPTAEKKVDSGIVILPIEFTIPLPFKEDDATLLHENTVYSKNPVTLRDYRGIRIEFNNPAPAEITLRGTTLYNASINGNAVMLSFRSSAFRKILDNYPAIKKEGKGMLTFRASLEVKGKTL